MGGGSMSGGQHRMSQHDWPRFRHGMMTVTANPAAVPAGMVSLIVHNAGYLNHELLVLPLPPGQQVGQRSVGSDGKVAETGTLAEVSANCAAGSGSGLSPGSAGWVSLTLPAGRYELLCNQAGHYTAGMYAELDVS
jgi:uncharacterized cupredoxin-like copper-binding protein